MGNNQWNIHPVNFGNQSVCAFIASDIYRDYAEDLRRDANYPPVGECPVKKRFCTLNAYMIDTNRIPSFVPGGLWRMRVDMSHGGIIVHSGYVYAKLEKIDLTS
jgi:hypothetical protein